MKYLSILLFVLIFTSCGEMIKEKKSTKKKERVQLSAGIGDEVKPKEMYGLLSYGKPDRGIKSLELIISYKRDGKIFTPKKMTVVDYIKHENVKYLHVRVNGSSGLLSIPRIDKSDKKMIAKLKSYIKFVLKVGNAREAQAKAAEYEKLYQVYKEKVSVKTLRYQHALRYAKSDHVEYTFSSYVKHYDSLSSFYQYYYQDSFNCVIGGDGRVPASSSFRKNRNDKIKSSLSSRDNDQSVTLYKGHDSVYYLSEKEAVQSYINNKEKFIFE